MVITSGQGRQEVTSSLATFRRIFGMSLASSKTTLRGGFATSLFGGLTRACASKTLAWKLAPLAEVHLMVLS
jgi:hypothetical protein